MAGADDHFVSRWRVAGTCGEVADVLSDALALPLWWPAVYLSAEESEPPGANGLGRRVRLHTKGWLPYTLTWELEVVESNYPYGFAIVARGDLNGRGVWTIAQAGPSVDILFDWRVRIGKPLLRAAAPVLGPVFAANHRWAMAQGEACLALELARRRTTSEAALARLPRPPGPVTFAGAGLLVAAGAVAGTLVYLIARARRRR